MPRRPGGGGGDPRGAQRESPAASNAIIKRCVKSLDDYFSNTSVHGVKYLTEYKRPLIERIAWLAGIIIAFTTCALLIEASWKNRWESPVILTLDKKQHTIWDIPFPAVTICPMQKLKSGVKILTPSTNESQYDHDCAIRMICGKKAGKHCENTSHPLNLFMEKLKPSSEFIYNIIMGNESKTEKLIPLLTTDGICYVFNMFPPPSIFKSNTFHATVSNFKPDCNFTNVTWDPQRFYQTNNRKDRFPQTPTGVGPDYSLLLILFEKESEESCGLEKGFKVQLHNPAEFPTSESEFLVPLNSRVKITLEPDLIFTEKGELENYAVEHRQCFFPEERTLEYFEVYTQNNCEFECFSKAVFDCCKCVPHYLPHNNSIGICRSEKDEKCVKDVKDKMVTSDLRPENYPCPEARFCNCLPSCSHLRYRGRNSLNHLYKHDVQRFLNDPRLDNSNISVVEIYFTSAHFIPFRRLELKGTIEFIADCGGVLGLCLGMSLLSVVELLYWLLLRPGWCRRCRRRSAPAGAATGGDVADSELGALSPAD